MSMAAASSAASSAAPSSSPSSALADLTPQPNLPQPAHQRRRSTSSPDKRMAVNALYRYFRTHGCGAKDHISALANTLYRPPTTVPRRETMSTTVHADVDEADLFVRQTVECFRQCKQLYVPTDNESRAGLLYVYIPPTPAAASKSVRLVVSATHSEDGVWWVSVGRSDGRGHALDCSIEKMDAAVVGVCARIAYALGMRAAGETAPTTTAAASSHDAAASVTIGPFASSIHPVRLQNSYHSCYGSGAISMFPSHLRGPEVAGAVCDEGRALLARTQAVVQAHFSADST